MKKLAPFVTLVLVLSLQQTTIAAAPEVGVIENFGPELSALCNLPEGVAVDPRGNVYASSLNFNATSGPANICVLDRGGNIVDAISVAPVPGGVARLLGMLYVQSEGLYVGDVGGGRVLRIDVDTHDATVVATGFGAPNAFARDHGGNLWVSDSFPGTLTKIAPDGQKTVFAYPEQLAPGPGESPPFGSRDEIYRIAYAHGALGAIELFARGTAGGALDGADGIAFDVRGNLYVCSNQSDEIAVLSPEGDVVAEYSGSGATAFNGPASLVFRGRSVYVANLALFHAGPQKVSVFTAPYPGAP